MEPPRLFRCRKTPRSRNTGTRAARPSLATTLPRDETIRYIRQHGRNKWKKVHDYHRRSLAETAVYRFKGLMGRFVEARTWENERTEVRLKAKTLNQMTRLGMPKISQIGV
jgi:hypothetical protein